MTLVVNIFGGPGTGKSTNAALTFGELKSQGYNVEMAHEYAKDLVWEGRNKAIGFQPYVIGKQMYRVHRLLGEVDAIITDSPVLFGLIYKERYICPEFDNFVVAQFKQWFTLNIFLVRDSEYHSYNPRGRFQTEEEAVAIDEKIKAMLKEHHIPYTSLVVNKYTPGDIVSLVKLNLDWNLENLKEIDAKNERIR